VPTRRNKRSPCWHKLVCVNQVTGGSPILRQRKLYATAHFRRAAFRPRWSITLFEDEFATIGRFSDYAPLTLCLRQVTTAAGENTTDQFLHRGLLQV
jgi:hypothetical protein